MNISDVLSREPNKSALANNGQARIITMPDEQAKKELRAELEMFVCDGQYGRAIETILSSYMRQLHQPRQNAAWVSGFFGSGKSHLLKMIAHLWVNTSFEDGTNARSLVNQLPSEVKALLRELDTYAAQIGKQAVAVAGPLTSNNSDVRLAILAIILQACGLPQQYNQAQFYFWLRRQGYLQHVIDTVKVSGKEWLREINDMYVSRPIAQALLECDPSLAADRRGLGEVLRAQFPIQRSDISTDQFIAAAREALAPDGVLPLTVLILDEVQQYLGDSSDRSTIFTEVTEAIQTQMDSRVMLVASGQSALTATPHLQKLRDRFRITIQLTDTDVEAVIRKVLLHKKPSAVGEVRGMLDRYAGEISRQLQGTRLAERPNDKDTIVADYPLLPTRRRFWEECFRAVDAAGTHSQLRSQLRILDEALKSIAEKELGTVIPADWLYQSIAADLVNTNVILSEVYRRIQEYDDGTDDGRLKSRLAGLIFLIGKLPREAGVDTGVRANASTLSDLLVEDLAIDSGLLRHRVAVVLEKMAADGELMRIDDEYRIQTAEGVEWDRSYRERAAALRNREAEIASLRDQLLAAEVQKALSELRILQGEAKVRRTVVLHARLDAPTNTVDQVVVWLRDGWSASQGDVENEARRRGQTDSIIHVFVPRHAANELRDLIIEVEAARRVLDTKGDPGTAPGREARESMNSRLQKAEQARNDLVREVVAGARVYQGGGNEVYGDGLYDKLLKAAEASLVRMYPRFAEGDHRSWDVALRRAREGSDQPFSVVGWSGPTEEHPVSRAILSEIGGGTRGSDVRKALKGGEYGWPQDAIDAALIALHRCGALRVTCNGELIPPGRLDQNRIPTAEFRLESVRLSAVDKIQVRGLYQKASVNARSGEEEAKAGEFLSRMLQLAHAAGGDPPLPARPDTRLLEDLQHLSGTEQVGAILKAKDELQRYIDTWTATAEAIRTHMAHWHLVEQLLKHAHGLPVTDEVQQYYDAIVANRSLLQSSDDIAHMRVKLSTALRHALTEHNKALHNTYAEGWRLLSADKAWAVLTDQQRSDILDRVGIKQPAELDIADDDSLLRELQRQPLPTRADAAVAAAARFQKALEEAARLLEPTAKKVTLRQATLRSPQDVKAWLAEQEERLLEAVQSGPVIVG